MKTARTCMCTCVAMLRGRVRALRGRAATRTACRHADVDALYWLYEHTDGASWKLNTNWAPHLD